MIDLVAWDLNNDNDTTRHEDREGHGEEPINKGRGGGGRGYKNKRASERASDRPDRATSYER